MLAIRLDFSHILSVKLRSSQDNGLFVTILLILTKGANIISTGDCIILLLNITPTAPWNREYVFRNLSKGNQITNYYTTYIVMLEKMAATPKYYFYTQISWILTLELNLLVFLQVHIDMTKCMKKC